MSKRKGRQRPGVTLRPERLSPIKVTLLEKDAIFSKAESHGITVADLVRKAVAAFPVGKGGGSD